MERPTKIIEGWFDDPLSDNGGGALTGASPPLFRPVMWGTTDFYDRAVELGMTDVDSIINVMALIDYAAVTSRRYDIDFDSMVTSIFELYFMDNLSTPEVRKFVLKDIHPIHKMRAAARMATAHVLFRYINPALASMTRWLNARSSRTRRK